MSPGPAAAATTGLGWRGLTWLLAPPLAVLLLRAPVDAFFDDVMVNAEQLDVRLNRLGLLKTLHQAMNRVADLSRLAA